MEQAQDRETIDPAKSAEPEGPEEPKETDDIDGPELKLPDWIRPDPGAGDKGKLLYIEEWATKNYFEEQWGLLLLVVTAVMLLIFVTSLWIPNGTTSTEDDRMGSTVMVAFGFSIIGPFEYLWICRMPFSLYQHGISKPRVRISNGLHRRESFVPWERIKLIRHEMKQEEGKMFLRSRLTVELTDDSSFKVNFDHISDPLFVLTHFHKTIPDKLHEDLASFVQPGSEDSQPCAISSFFSGNSEFGLILLILITSILFATFSVTGGVCMSPLFLAVIFLVLHSDMNNNDFRIQRELIRHRARLTRNGIAFPRTYFRKLFYTVREPLPLNTIISIKKVMHPVSYYREAEVETTCNERIRIPLGLFERLRKDERFIDHGDHLLPKIPPMDSKVFEKWDRKKMIEYAIVFIGAHIIVADRFAIISYLMERLL